jgi:hypothetical protein
LECAIVCGGRKQVKFECVSDILKNPGKARYIKLNTSAKTYYIVHS